MDLPSIPAYMQIEEVDEGAPVSESMLQKLGQSMNYLLDKVDTQCVGTLDASDLNETQYQLTRGAGWILCDGRTVSGSRFSVLTGNSTVPDMRGMFPRMKDFSPNVFPNVSGRNPDGNLALGSYQGDQYNSHNHFQAGGFPFEGIAFADVRGPGLNSSGDVDAIAIRSSTFTLYPSSNGGTDSRPRNRSMNWFVRIN